MADLGLHGAIRGKPIRTTVQDKAAPCPLDPVKRVFHGPAPNRLWLSDFTHVSTRPGFVYMAPRHGHSYQRRSHGPIIHA